MKRVEKECSKNGDSCPTHQKNQIFEKSRITCIDYLTNDLRVCKYWLSYANLVLNDLQLDIENNSAQKVWQEVEFVFGKGLLKHQLLFQFVVFFSSV